MEQCKHLKREMYGENTTEVENVAATWNETGKEFIGFNMIEKKWAIH